MQPTGHFKLCPNCKTPAFLQETVCRSCGRAFQGVNTPQSLGPTPYHYVQQPAYARPPSQTAKFLWYCVIAFCGILAGGGLGSLLENFENVMNGDVVPSALAGGILVMILLAGGIGAAFIKIREQDGGDAQRPLLTTGVFIGVGFLMPLLYGVAKKPPEEEGLSVTTINMFDCVSHQPFIFVPDYCGTPDSRGEDGYIKYLTYETSRGEEVTISADFQSGKQQVIATKDGVILKQDP